jgi:uncharacterized Zn-binding protein involved in type VI secretion
MPSLGGVGNAIAGGRVVTGSQSVTVNDLPVVIIGSNVAGHGRDEHSGPVMVTGSQSVTVGDIGVCVYGNHASCGHAMTCNSDVEVGL